MSIAITMNEIPQSQSPLNQIDLSVLADNPQLQLREVPLQAFVILRGKSDDASFTSVAAQVLGNELPIKANTWATSKKADMLWYGPSEWLLVVEPGELDSLLEELTTQLKNTHAGVVDVTGGSTMLEISGPATIELLAKASPFDFHPSVFTRDQCVQTVFAKASATVYPFAIDGETITSFRVIFRRSFADYLGTCLLDAAEEYVQD